MSYVDVLDRYEGMIVKDLEGLLGRELEREAGYHPFTAEVYRGLREFVLRGGRRLASCSTLVVYKGYGGGLNGSVLRACSGVELYRHAILAHDDIVDREAMRRGGPTLHRVYEVGYDEPFGIGSALFAGNLLFSMALEAVMESGFEKDLLADATGLITSEYRDVNDSQILDLLFEYGAPTREEWEVMASKRAATLFRASMLTGAILARAPSGDIGLLEDAARHIGFAFDIQDDIIDTFASEEQYGRVPCEDISKRKKPLHVVIAMERDERFASIVQRGMALSKGEIEEVRDLIRDCGALDEAKSISVGHARVAKRLLSSTEMGEEERGFFTSFIDYIVESLDWYS